MAIQMNVNLPGGGGASNCYVRVVKVRAFKKDVMPDGRGPWMLMIDVYVYKDKAERDKGQGAEMITCPEVDRFKFDFDPSSETGDMIELAYNKLKTHDIFSDADFSRYN